MTNSFSLFSPFLSPSLSPCLFLPAGDVELTSYVFNGDWVDRGAHQLEVVLLLFSLKVLYPARVFLVRGNHEFRSQSEAMGAGGFMHHVKARFVAEGVRVAATVYEAIHHTFEWLPLAAVIAEAVLVLHGGLGDGTWTVKDLASTSRPIRELAPGTCAMQALWSDPSDSDEAMARGVHASGRGPGIPTFGPDVTGAFCERENLQLVIRSHQFVMDGFKVMHSGKVRTSFSTCLSLSHFLSNPVSSPRSFAHLPPPPPLPAHHAV